MQFRAEGLVHIMNKIKLILTFYLILISISAISCAAPNPGWALESYSAEIADCVIQLTSDRNNGPLQPADGCDNWYIDLYERPTAQEPKANDRNTYYSQVDIVKAMFGEDANFYYSLKPNFNN